MGNSTFSINLVIQNFLMTFLVIPICLLVFPQGQLNFCLIMSIEWLLIIIVYSILCPWMERKGLFWLVLFYVCVYFVDRIVTTEHLNMFGAVHTYSDDYLYLSNACDVGTSLKQNGFNLFAAWQTCNLDWTIKGWPFLLGVFSYFTDCSIDQVYVLALSLNATFLVFIFIFILNFFNIGAKKYFYIFILFFVLSMPELLVEAAQSRKDTLIMLGIVLYFIGFIKLLEEKKKRGWFLVLVISLLIIIFTRPVYLIIFFSLLFFRFIQKNRLNLFFKIAIVSIFLLGFIYVSNHSIISVRGLTIADFSENYGKMGANDPAAIINYSGLGFKIFNIPLIGPWIFYLIAPIPLNPSEFLFGKLPIISSMFIESVGSVDYLVMFFMMIYYWYKRPKQSDNVVLLGVLFFMIFASAVIFSSEPRYKLQTNILLFMLVFKLWVDKNVRKRFEKPDSKRQF